MISSELTQFSLSTVSMVAGAIGAAAAVIGLFAALLPRWIGTWLNRARRTREIELKTAMEAAMEVARYDMDKLIKDVRNIKARAEAELLMVENDLRQEDSASKAPTVSESALADQIHQVEQLIETIGEADSIFRDVRARQG